MSVDLAALIDRPVSVITLDGKNLVGVLKGYDQRVNLALDNCVERVFSPTEPVEEVVLGLYLVRGDSVAVVAGIDPELAAGVDVSTIRGEQLRPLIV